MSITYGTITYISNGQAINADNLNAPSVDLEARTDEVKRDSDQLRFEHLHTGDVQAVLASSNPDIASVTLKTELREDGKTNSSLVKYYRVELNNCSFSVYAKSVPGGRYIIPGSALGDLFSDGVTADQRVLSTNLTVPGDGIYAKIPLRHTGSAESLSNYPDLILPKSTAESLGNEYLDNFGAGLVPELVKLPMYTDIELFNQADTSVDSFLTLLGSEFEGTVISISSEGSLAIQDDEGTPLTLKLSGTPQGAECIVSHILPGSVAQSIVLRVTAATSPIYPELINKVPTSSLVLALYKDQTLAATSTTLQSSLVYPGYLVKPRLLDPAFSYVPLVRLHENSISVADRNYSLVPSYLDNGTQINKYGAPVDGVLPTFTNEDTDEIEVFLFRKDLRRTLDYTGKHTLSFPLRTVTDNYANGEIRAKSSDFSDYLEEVLNAAGGDYTMHLLEVRFKLVDQFDTDGTNFEFSTVYMLNAQDTTFTKSITLSRNSIEDGSVVEINGGGTARQAINESTSVPRSIDVLVTSDANITSGAFIAEVDIFIE